MEANNFFSGGEGNVNKSEFIRPCVICHKLTPYRELNYHAYVCSNECLFKFEEISEKAQQGEI